MGSGVAVGDGNGVSNDAHDGSGEIDRADPSSGEDDWCGSIASSGSSRSESSERTW